MRKLFFLIALFTFAKAYSQIVVGKYVLTSIYISSKDARPIYFDVISCDSICNQVNGNTKKSFIKGILSRSFYTADAAIEELCDSIFEKKDIDSLLYFSGREHMDRLVHLEEELSYKKIKKLDTATTRKKKLRDCNVYYEMYSIYGIFYKTDSDKGFLISNSNSINLEDYKIQGCMVPLIVYFSSPF